MLPKMLSYIAIAVLAVIGAAYWLGTPTVRPLQASSQVPTFRQVQEQLRTGDSRTRTAAINGARPWAEQDARNEHVRDIARKSALENLTKETGRACSRDSHKRLFDALSYYLGHRTRQQNIYARNWGSEGNGFITQAWATPDDRQIERMIRQAYAAGEFSLDEFKTRIGGPLLERLVAGMQVAKLRCQV